MGGTYVAGIDIGTTSVCCVVADAAGGAVVHTETRANDARPPSLRRNPALRRLLKQRLELPFHLSAVEEEAAFGTAINAAAAGGLFPDIPAALAGMQAAAASGNHRRTGQDRQSRRQTIITEANIR